MRVAQNVLEKPIGDKVENLARWSRSYGDRADRHQGDIVAWENVQVDGGVVHENELLQGCGRFDASWARCPSENGRVADSSRASRDAVDPIDRIPRRTTSPRVASSACAAGSSDWALRAHPRSSSRTDRPERSG